MIKVTAQPTELKQEFESVVGKGDIFKCSNCQGINIVFDPQTGEKLCENCGAVLAEKLESSESQLKTKPEDQKPGAHAGIPTSLVQVDKGLSTVIPFTVTDGNGVRMSADQRSNMVKMRRWNKISNCNRTYHRNLKSALPLIQRVKDKLSLNEALAEKAAYYYRKTLDLNVIKGRSIEGFVAGCIYVACREVNIPRTLEEICKAMDTDHIFAGKCYRILVRRMNIRLPEIDVRIHLSRIAASAGVSEKTTRRAAELMAIVKNKPMSFGKDPNALSVGVLYAACLNQGEKVNQKRLADSANMSIVTLRKRYLDIQKIFPSLA
ncbi:MAG TPA: TFIIB-type zinc ribbon-containing protein [Nitrososphaeraceae archaeon]